MSMRTTAAGVPTPEVAEQGVDVDGARMRVLTAGTGPALVYLHGVGDLGGWLPFLADLARSHHVVRPDHPGFNGSEDTGAGCPAELARQHARLLDRLGLTEVLVVGCSLGGWVATELALQQPDRVRGLVLIDPAGMPAPEPAPRVLDLEPAESAELTFHAAAVRAAAVERGRSMATRDPDAAARELRNRAAARRLAGDPYMHDPTLPARVAGLGQPVRLLWGEFDRIVPVSHARAWTAALPQAELSIVPGTGHLPHVEQPAVCAQLARLD